MTPVFLVAGLALGANVHVRKETNLCMDFAGATDQQPIRTAACVKGKATQEMGFDSKTGYIELGGNAICQEGPPCCLENFFGSGITIWGCSDPSGKTFSFDNSTGQIKSQGGCLTAGAVGSPIEVRPCNMSNMDQMWDMEEGKPLPGPSGDTCAQLGCMINWRPGLPCQCNSDCCSYGNCCPDFHQHCGACQPRPPAPPPWPCTPCWRCGNCPPGPPPGTSCPNMAGVWTYAGTDIVITQEQCAIDARGPARSWKWKTAVGSFTTEWNIDLKVVSSSKSETWNGHINGCSASTCGSGDTVVWTEPSGLSETWTKKA
eukprot:m.160162 g.160162  ORF g.160162 m.160162 type:complete len:316 (-) comp11906_c0_seq1:118-1065(-)